MFNVNSVYKLINEDQIVSVTKSIEKLRDDDELVDTLLGRLMEHGELLLVGGAIRDISNNLQPRDYDFISLLSADQLSHIMQDFPHIQNRFKGFKVFLPSTTFDIWSIHTHWPFTNHILPMSIPNLKYGTFFQLDSLFLNLSTMGFDATLYHQDITNQVIETPLSSESICNYTYIELQIVKSCIFMKRTGFPLSPKLSSFFTKWLIDTENAENLLIQCQYKHYKKLLFSPLDIIHLINSTQSSRIEN